MDLTIYIYNFLTEQCHLFDIIKSLSVCDYISVTVATVKNIHNLQQSFDIHLDCNDDVSTLKCSLNFLKRFPTECKLYYFNFVILSKL